MYPIFKDKISLWGNIQKNYLTKQHNIPDERIILSGSPRHDIFFHTTSEKTSSSKLKILITLGILDEQNAIFDTELFLRFESTLEKIFLTLKNLDNISFIVKLHPSSQKNNMYMKKFIHKFDEKIIIHQFTSILDEIQDCDIMINIFTEIYGSTVMLEGLILEKPILNISLDTRLYEFEFEKNNAVLSKSYSDNIDQSIKEILFDKNLQENLIKNGHKHVNQYLANPGNASKELARILSSF
jgi:UDP-N-acetylglucosamine 2-epimerase